MSEKHTPGPWGCVDTSYDAHDYRLTRPDGSTLPVHASGNDHSEQRANARLIAAAPDLLEALRELLAWPPLVGCADTRVAKARAAIAKVKGD